MTYYIAAYLGLDKVSSGYSDFSQADMIAWADQNVDSNAETGPNKGNTISWENLLHRDARQKFHFPCSSKYGLCTVEEGSSVSSEYVNKGIANCDPMLVGIGLHVYQDSWAHSGYEPTIGHGTEVLSQKQKVIAASSYIVSGVFSAGSYIYKSYDKDRGYIPDAPYQDIDKSMRMAEATYDKLREYIDNNPNIRREIQDKLQMCVAFPENMPDDLKNDLRKTFAEAKGDNYSDVGKRSKKWGELTSIDYSNHDEWNDAFEKAAGIK